MADGGVNASTITVETGVASLRVTLLGEGPTVVMFPSLGRDVEDFDELAATRSPAPATGRRPSPLAGSAAAPAPWKA